MNGGPYPMDFPNAGPADNPAVFTMTPDGAVRRAVVVVMNPQGLHMRPASVFARRAAAFACNVTVSRSGNPADGKSMLALLLLAAEPGAELVLEVDGPDADAALPTLAEILGAADAADD